MDHRTTSQEASPNGHQKPESAAASDTEASRIWNYIRKLEHDNNQAAATISALREEVKAAYERIAKLEADLHECREYIEQEADVVDGDYGEPAPNRAMQLVSMIDETLNGPGAF